MTPALILLGALSLALSRVPSPGAVGAHALAAGSVSGRRTRDVGVVRGRALARRTGVSVGTSRLLALGSPVRSCRPPTCGACSGFRSRSWRSTRWWPAVWPRAGRARRRGCGLLAGLVAAGDLAVRRHAHEARRRAVRAPRCACRSRNRTSTCHQVETRVQGLELREIEKQSAQARDAGADIVIFPETCAPMLHRERARVQDAPDRARALARDSHLRRLSRPPFRRAQPRLNIYNSSGRLSHRRRRCEKYDKRHLLAVRRSAPARLALSLDSQDRFRSGQLSAGSGARAARLETESASRR